MKKEGKTTHKNIVIFCNEDIIANITLNYLLPSLIERNLKPEIFLSQKKSRKEEERVEELSKFNFLTKDYICKIIFPIIEESLNTNQKGSLMTFNQLSREYDCEIHRIQSTKKREEQNKIIAVYKDKQPYISLSIKNNLIINSKIIKVASSYGVGKIFNVHSSKLPERAGVWCALWDMVEGKSLYGTLHAVEEGIDTGSIIETYSIPIDKKNSYLKNSCLIYQKGAQIFLEFIDKLTNGDSQDSKQQNFSKRKYYKTPTSEELNKIDSLGVKLFSDSEYYEILSNYGYKENLLKLIPFCLEEEYIKNSMTSLPH